MEVEKIPPQPHRHVSIAKGSQTFNLSNGIYSLIDLWPLRCAYYLERDERVHVHECVSEKDILAFVIASLDGCFLGNEAAGALGGKVC